MQIVDYQHQRLVERVELRRQPLDRDPAAPVGRSHHPLRQVLSRQS